MKTMAKWPLLFSFLPILRNRTLAGLICLHLNFDFVTIRFVVTLFFPTGVRTLTGL